VLDFLTSLLEPPAGILIEFPQNEVALLVKTASLQAELLVRLRDVAGLKFRKIIELPVFSDLQYFSMSCLCQNFKKKHTQAK
jgi:hypothetical protein